jgi:GNAT superfamily N-acetyltransferase
VLRVETCHGAALAAHLPALARLRLSVFRAWPYLYDGSEAYERGYLATYLRAPGAAIVVAWDGDAAVGAATCLPMREAAAEVQLPFVAAGADLERVFYFGESVLLPQYRGQGVGVRFFEHREAQARAQGAAQASFCAVERPADHPARPAGAQGLEAFWAHRGYARVPGLVCHMAWKDLGDSEESTKTMQFWRRDLVS